ncbi:glycosyltransferase [Photobacterium japonica]|uniref:glycosyltransferase n=1 Tax=Photobacterium japonica TaxID=2910235 RepID=UPI003D142369
MYKSIILVAPGFYKKTGYFFRAIRDKNALEINGHEITVIGYKLFFFYDVDGRKIPYNTVFSLLKNSDYIISENIAPSIFSLPFKKKKRVMVVHGSLEDLQPFRFYHIKKFIYSFLLKYALKNYTSIISVSNAMNDYLNGLTSSNIKNITTIPNLPDDIFLQNIQSARNSQNLFDSIGLDKERKYICYCGNSQKWQKIDFLLDVFSYIHKQDNKIDLVILTKDLETFDKEIRKREISAERIVLKTVENPEVPNFLVASNLLYLLRDDDEINNVACPTKAMEYLSSGTDIIVSKGLGDITSIVDSEDKGIVVDLDSNTKISIVGDLIIHRINNNRTQRIVDIDKYRLSNYDKEYEKL